MTDLDKLEAFYDLFQGRTDARGSIEGGCIREKVTIADYERHLKGEVSLGVYPLLDDGTCHFFAVDLDEKDFEKAKSIRQELSNVFIPAYISNSRRKGYHIYGFAQDKVIAKEIRTILNNILNKLSIKAEIFPKQDNTSEKIPLGNYINLPCFGYQRQFLTIEHKEIPIEKALGKIKRTPQESIDRALRVLPKVVEEIKPKKVVGRPKKGAPPCVEAMLQGVGEGARDEAAFALARHYFDFNYLPEEVLSLLMVWDKRNTPPLDDIKLLEAKVNSAQKGYSFGCDSIQKNPMLQSFCVGQENCKFFQKSMEERKKKGLIRELTYYETENIVYEEIIPPDGEPTFVAYDKALDEITYHNTIDCDKFSIIPYQGEEITQGAVTLPSGIEEYGDTLTLVANIKAHIHEFADFPPLIEEFAAWYIIMSWIYDRLPTVSYMRFRGDTGCGKSRALDVVGRLCYKPMMLSGAITPAPIYRIIRRFRGTLVLDEADFSDSSEKAEVVTILNCGFERNRPVIRCNKNDPNDLEILTCFGPKVFATRQDFADKALESRCITNIMEETDRVDIPAILGNGFYSREDLLRKQLLMWRLKHVFKIDAKQIDQIDLGNIEPRLKQTGMPYALSFKDYPEVMEKFKAFIKEYNADLIKERANSDTGRVVLAFLKATQEHGKGNVNASIIKDRLSSEFNLEMTTAKIGTQIKSLGLKDKTRRRDAKGHYCNFYNWDFARMKKLIRRYIVDFEDYEDLLEVDLEI